MKALFVGGHPAVDFLNTSFSPDGRPVETLADGGALLAWLVEAELVQDDEAAKLTRRVGIRALDQAAAEARKMREWARQWLSSWRTGGRDWHASLDALNQRLSRLAYRRAVRGTGEGVEIVERPLLEGTDGLLALLAEQLASLLARERPELVKTCEGTGCTLWFVDRTKTHRRRFCSATACGNRAKVAAFRKRQRAAS